MPPLEPLSGDELYLKDFTNLLATKFTDVISVEKAFFGRRPDLQQEGRLGECSNYRRLRTISLRREVQSLR